MLVEKTVTRAQTFSSVDNLPGLKEIAFRFDAGLRHRTRVSWGALACYLVMRLTPSAIAAAKPREKPWKLSDGFGLHLLIQPNGKRFWRWSFRCGGKQQTLSFGAYPLVSLLEARQKLADGRQQLRQGLHPGLIRREDKAARTRRPLVAHVTADGQREAYTALRRALGEPNYALQRWSLRTGTYEQEGLGWLLADCRSEVDWVRVTFSPDGLFGASVIYSREIERLLDSGTLRSANIERTTAVEQVREHLRALTAPSARDALRFLDEVLKRAGYRQCRWPPLVG